MFFSESDYPYLRSIYTDMDMIDMPEPVIPKATNITLQNKKYLLAVLCVTENADYLSESENLLLSRILQYIKLSSSDTPIFVCSVLFPYTFAQLRRLNCFEQLIIFGGSRKLQLLQIDIGKGYQPVDLCGIKFYFVHSLAELEKDAKKKKLLYDMLNNFFSSV